MISEIEKALYRIREANMYLNKARRKPKYLNKSFKILALQDRLGEIMDELREELKEDK